MQRQERDQPDAIRPVRVLSCVYDLQSQMLRWQASWSAPTLSCWGHQATPGKTGKLTMWSQHGVLIEEQLTFLSEHDAAQRLADLQGDQEAQQALQQLEQQQQREALHYQVLQQQAPQQRAHAQLQQAQHDVQVAAVDPKPNDRVEHGIHATLFPRGRGGWYKKPNEFVEPMAMTCAHGIPAFSLTFTANESEWADVTSATQGVTKR